MKILAFDPSGEFRKGKGTTGYCFMEDGVIKEVGETRAEIYKNAPAYWNSHIWVIDKFSPDYVVCESYQLYNHPGKKAAIQSYSYMETPQLIGVITVHCWRKNIPLVFQTASQAKRRWSNDLLIKEGFIKSKKGYSSHKLDAIRHAVHFYRYGYRKLKNEA